MLTPRLADLLELLSVVSAATHSVEILWNERMVVAWQGKPIHVNRPFVACICSQSDAYTAIDGARLRLHQVEQLTYDHVGAGNSPGNRRFHRGQANHFMV